MRLETALFRSGGRRPQAARSAARSARPCGSARAAHLAAHGVTGGAQALVARGVDRPDAGHEHRRGCRRSGRRRVVGHLARAAQHLVRAGAVDLFDLRAEPRCLGGATAARSQSEHRDCTDQHAPEAQPSGGWPRRRCVRASNRAPRRSGGTGRHQSQGGCARSRAGSQDRRGSEPRPCCWPGPATSGRRCRRSLRPGLPPA